MPKAGSGPTLDGQRRPLWLLLELTYRCPLKCSWCNNPLEFAEYFDNELSTEDWLRVMRQGRAMGGLQLGFSGGEPMLRRDLEVLVGEADRMGYYTNLITSGMGLDDGRLRDLKKAGLKQIQLSLQSCDKETNDRLVGVPAYDRKMAVAHAIKAEGFPMVMNIPVSRENIEHVDGILALAEEIGVDYLEFANVQYYNWAMINRLSLLPTQEQLERAEAKVNEARARLGNKMTIYFVIPDYFTDRPKACMNGWGSIHLTISPDGTALPCQEARNIKTLSFPNVRDHDLSWIWHDSPAFNAFRGDGWMKDPCRTCDEREKDFGGCRCQAFLLTGDAANADPACGKSRHHHLIRDVVQEAASLQTREPLLLRERGTFAKCAE